MKTLKSKLAGTVLMGALVVGGAAASASQFSEGAVSTQAGNVITWAVNTLGGQVDQNSADKKTEVENYVASEFNRVATSVAGTYNTELNTANGNVNQYAIDYKADVTSFADAQKVDAETRLRNKAVERETAGKNAINEAARAKALALIPGN